MTPEDFAFNRFQGRPNSRFGRPSEGMYGQRRGHMRMPQQQTADRMREYGGVKTQPAMSNRMHTRQDMPEFRGRSGERGLDRAQLNHRLRQARPQPMQRPQARPERPQVAPPVEQAPERRLRGRFKESRGNQFGLDRGRAKKFLRNHPKFARNRRAGRRGF